MARWVQLASEWLKPIYRQIKDQMMRGSYLQVDETPIRYLDPGNGKTGLGYLWVAHRPGEDGIRPSNPWSMASPESTGFSFGPAKRWE